jgi:hypothetical protein
MTIGRMKRCTNPACKANTGIRQAFPAEKTTCPLCGSRLVFIDPPRAAGKGSAKGGGKIVGHKVVRHGSSNPKPRKEKQPKKWNLKDAPRKNIGRKR